MNPTELLAEVADKIRTTGAGYITAARARSVLNNMINSTVTSVAGRLGDVTVVSNDISDATTAGKALMRGADATAQRTSLGLGGASILNVGTTGGTVAAGNDSRLSDARTPTTHAASHASGGGDPVTLAQSQITGLATALSDLTAAIASIGNLGGNELYNFKAKINAQTGTTYTLQSSDKGKIITFSNASAITVTVPSGLGAGFSCTPIQKGVGQVTFSASGTTINNFDGHTKTAGIHAITSLVADVADNLYLAGQTAA